MKLSIALLSILLFFIILSGCNSDSVTDSVFQIPEGTWGVYSLKLNSGDLELIFDTDDALGVLRLHPDGQSLLFSSSLSGNQNSEEICVYSFDDDSIVYLTDNDFLDTYPCWSPDGSTIAFLSWRIQDLDIFKMNADGSNQQPLYNSGGNDADIDWVGNKIAYTQGSQIWMIDDDGSNPVQITDPPNAGQWGQANLPFGDYDPRISPDGMKIVFERLENDFSVYGNYNLFLIDIDGTNETRLTDNGYSQGLASWSHDGSEIVYIVAAIGEEGKYDIWMMNADGSNNRNITPGILPADFLCHSAIFSADDSQIYFIWERWQL